MKILWLLGLDVDIPLWVLIILGLLVAYYVYMTWNFGVFKKMGIPGPKPLPIFGNFLDLLKGGWDSDRKYIEKYGGVVGLFGGRLPEILFSDPEIIRHVMVKDFDHFVNRSAFDIAARPFDRGLTNLRDDEWRNVRNTLSPTFSSGKIKLMVAHINGCADQLIDNLEEFAKDDKPVDIMKYSSAFTMDCIARTAFGYELNTQKDQENQFVKMADKAVKASLKNPLVFVLFFFPFALGFLGKLGLIRSMAKDISSFFCGFIEQAMQKRRELGKKSKADDFLQLVVNAHEDQGDDEEEEGYKLGNAHKKKLTNDEVLANALLFFFGGFDTVGNTLIFTSYCLAKHPECQEKLCKEIDEVLGDKRPSYDDLKKLPYLEQVINESQRMYPQAPMIQRYCDKDITIKGVHIPKGFTVRIPVYALHFDENHWNNPKDFDPERFTPEQIESRHPFVYLPFGLGPRMCIANRLALTEIKLAVVRVLQAGYKFETCSETQDPIVLETFRMKPKGELLLKVTKRIKS